MVEHSGGLPAIEGDARIGVEDLLLVRQSQMQIEIGRSCPDELPADYAGSADGDKSTPGA